jgi:actin-related protein 6
VFYFFLFAFAMVIILDNGAGKLKYGTQRDASPRMISNCSAKLNKQMVVLVGDQVDDSLNGSLLHYQRPFEKGYLTKWCHQIDVWNRLFGSTFLDITPSEQSLFLTEPACNPESIQNDTNEVVFEEFGFKQYCRRTAAWCSAYEFARDPIASDGSSVEFPTCCTVVDSGFSFSHIAPILDSKFKKNAVQ